MSPNAWPRRHFDIFSSRDWKAQSVQRFLSLVSFKSGTRFNWTRPSPSSEPNHQSYSLKLSRLTVWHWSTKSNKKRIRHEQPSIRRVSHSSLFCDLERTHITKISSRRRRGVQQGLSRHSVAGDHYTPSRIAFSTLSRAAPKSRRTKAIYKPTRGLVFARQRAAGD